MAIYTAIAAGGNWSNNATWGGGGHPVAGDTAIIDATMTGTVTIDVSSACAVLNCAGNGGTLALGNSVLTVSGNVTLGGTITAGTATLVITGTSTITSNGVSLPCKVNLSASVTFTLVGNFVCTSTLSVTSGTVTLAGAYNISCANFILGNSSGQFTLVSGQTFAVTNAMTVCNPVAPLTIKSSTASSAAYLVYQGTTDNCKIALVAFTDIDASGSAQGINNWYGGTLTRTVNITNRTMADIGAGGVPKLIFMDEDTAIYLSGNRYTKL